MTNTQGTSAIGGTAGTSSSQSNNPNMHYDTPPIQVGNAVRDGDQFVLLVKSRQSNDYQVWSSGDQTQTRDLFTQARRQVDELTNA